MSLTAIASPERVAALAHRLRAHAELHNIFVRSLRARNKWLLASAACLLAPEPELVILPIIVGLGSWARHDHVMDSGAEPLSSDHSSNLFNFYIVRPPVPVIAETLERVKSPELAEEILREAMCSDPTYRYYLFLSKKKYDRSTSDCVKEEL